MARILVIDDDSKTAEYLVDVLEKGGDYQVEPVPDSELAQQLLDSGGFNVVITEFDACVPKNQSVFDQVVRQHPETSCIIFTKHATVKNSVEAFRRGAADYLTKPANPEEIIAAVKKAVDRGRSAKQEKTRPNARQNFRYWDLVGNSPGILKVLNSIEKVAKTDSTVLITGESGTGKELIARAIHHNSDRSEKNMVVINCGAIPGELLESELFGHEKGAFTGAHRTRIGRFEMADDSSIFLDEIGDMSPDLQVKLLRVLQEQSFERVGSTKTIKVDVRIIAATNKDLMSSIRSGSFREDLYYRLNVIPINVPPLRERRSDIPLLIQYFLKRMGGRRAQDRKRMKTFSDEAIDSLMAYDWPGNIRELENMVERLSVLVEHETISILDLPERIRGKLPADRRPAVISLENGFDFNAAIERYQKDLILQALNQTNWVKAKAAELLKMNRTTLVEKIKKLDLESARG